MINISLRFDDSWNKIYCRIPLKGSSLVSTDVLQSSDALQVLTTPSPDQGVFWLMACEPKNGVPLDIPREAKNRNFFAQKALIQTRLGESSNLAQSSIHLARASGVVRKSASHLVIWRDLLNIYTIFRNLTATPYVKFHLVTWVFSFFLLQFEQTLWDSLTAGNYLFVSAVHMFLSLFV